MQKRARIAISALTLSASALVGMAIHEGYRDTAYHATADEKQRGISTIGFGTTGGVKPGDRVTPERALVRLLEDADKFQSGLKACIGDVPLYQHEWDAYVSWAYNVGTGAACSSTLVKLLKQSPPAYSAACDQLLRWDKQSGRTLPGLTKRRAEEHQKCLGS